MKLNWVHCIPVDYLADASFAGPPDLRGYARVPSQEDNTLFGSLQMRGDIGREIDYFRPQYSKDGGPWTDLPTPQFAGYSRRYWQGAAGYSPYIPFVPTSKTYGSGNVVVISTRHHYEELNPGLPTFSGEVYWDDWDTLFYFATDATPSLGDGLYELRFVGYQADASDDLVAGSEYVIRTCGLPTWETVYLRIDNQANPHGHPAIDHDCGGITTHLCVDEPEAYIRSLVKNEGLWNEQPVSVCDIVELQPTDTLTVHFTVTVPPNDQDGHLGGYEMVANYGASLQFSLGGATLGAPCPDRLRRVSRHLRGGSSERIRAGRSVVRGRACAGRTTAALVRRELQGDAPRLRLPGLLRVRDLSTRVEALVERVQLDPVDALQPVPQHLHRSSARQVSAHLSRHP